MFPDKGTTMLTLIVKCTSFLISNLTHGALAKDFVEDFSLKSYLANEYIQTDFFLKNYLAKIYIQIGIQIHQNTLENDPMLKASRI